MKNKEKNLLELLDKVELLEFVENQPTKLETLVGEKGGKLSLNNDRSSAIVLPTISGLVDINCPSLTNEGPSSFNACAILNPSDLFLWFLSQDTPIEIKLVKKINKNLNRIFLFIKINTLYFFSTLISLIKNSKLLSIYNFCGIVYGYYSIKNITIVYIFKFCTLNYFFKIFL